MSIGITFQIHSFYGNARDIEWGMKDGRIYMLQSRPVTNLDNSFTDFEIMHEIDSVHHSEAEFISRAHWGENFPGSTSYTSLAWNIKLSDSAMAVTILLMIIIIINNNNNNNDYWTLIE